MGRYELEDDLLASLIDSEAFFGAQAQIRAIYRALYRYACHLDTEGQHARYDHVMEAANTLQPIVEPEL